MHRTAISLRRLTLRPSFFLLRRIGALIALRRSRLALARLDMRLLSDIGLDDATAKQEAARRLWDAPSYWSSPFHNRF